MIPKTPHSILIDDTNMFMLLSNHGRAHKKGRIIITVTAFLLGAALPYSAYLYLADILEPNRLVEEVVIGHHSYIQSNGIYQSSDTKTREYGDGQGNDGKSLTLVVVSQLPAKASLIDASNDMYSQVRSTILQNDTIKTRVQNFFK